MKVIGGYSLETIYFWVLVICAGIATLLFLFGDIFNFDGPLDPMLLVPWFAFGALVGYLGEKLTDWHSGVILAIAIVVATLLVFLFNFYILVPMRSAESTLSSSEKDLEGRMATVVTPIPVGGMGEIQIVSVTGSVTRPASFYQDEQESIPKGEQVLIIEIEKRVCYVVPYKENFYQKKV